MPIQWDNEISNLLSQLSATQQQLLELLGKKREMLIKRDHQGLQRLSEQENQLCEQLKDCQQQRQQLLERAEASGLPADSIESLAGALPADSGEKLQAPLAESKERSHLLRHQSIAQWVAVQRTLLHLSQLLEIIATGGHGQTTYGRGNTSVSSGRLMDQAV